MGKRLDKVREGLESRAWGSSGGLGKSFSSETASARTRSSHFPRTASILLPMRWVGVHRRDMVDGVEVLLPVVRELMVETEPDLESDPVWAVPRSRRRA
jgi:hypothetical protein